MITAHDLILDQFDPDEGSDKRLTTWYAQGQSDAIGDRLLMFDNTNLPSWEILRFRPALAHNPRFEAAVAEAGRAIDRVSTRLVPARPADQAAGARRRAGGGIHLLVGRVAVGGAEEAEKRGIRAAADSSARAGARGPPAPRNDPRSLDPRSHHSQRRGSVGNPRAHGGISAREPRTAVGQALVGVWRAGPAHGDRRGNARRAVRRGATGAHRRLPAWPDAGSPTKSTRTHSMRCWTRSRFDTKGQGPCGSRIFVAGSNAHCGWATNRSIRHTRPKPRLRGCRTSPNGAGTMCKRPCRRSRRKFPPRRTTPMWSGARRLPAPADPSRRARGAGTPWCRAPVARRSANVDSLGHRGHVCRGARRGGGHCPVAARSLDRCRHRDAKAAIPPPRVEILPIEPPPQAPPIVVTTANGRSNAPRNPSGGATGRARANWCVSSVGAD